MKSPSVVYSWTTEPIRSLTGEETAKAREGRASYLRRLIGLELSSRISLIVIGIALSVHGYEIFSSHLTIDEELLIDRDAWMSWVAQGRWGMGVLNYAVMPRPIGPVVSTLIGVLGFLLALLVTVKGLARSEVSLIISTGVGIAAPTLPFLLSFSTLSYGAGLAALAGALAARSGLLIAGPAGIGVSLALVVSAVAIYEPFLFVFPMVAVLWLTGAAVARGLDLGTALQCVFRVTVVGAVGIVISRLMTPAVQAITDVAPSPYVGSLLDIGGLLEAPSERARAAIRETWLVLSGSQSVFGAELSLLGGVLVCSLLLITAGVLLTQWRRGAVVSLALLGATMAVPLAAELLTAGLVPLRSQVYLPFLLAGIVAIALEAAASWRVGPLRVLLPAAAGLLGLALMSYSNRLYLSTEIAFARDRQVAFELDRQISRVISDEGAQELAVIGALYREDLPTPAAETMGASFFEWDGGNAPRVAGVLRYVTGRPIQPADSAGSLKLAERAEGMPTWPLEGSVRRIGTTIVVKFGDPTSEQVALWCQSSASTLCSSVQ